MTNIERFMLLGGKVVEISAVSTSVIYKEMTFEVPSHYFTSNNKQEQEVLDYYLDVLPKILIN